MYTADAITQGYLSVNTREYDCKIEIYDSGGVLQDTITQSDGLIYPFTIDHSIQAGDYFTIGSIHSSSLNLALDDSVTVPTNGEFRVFLRLNGTSGYGDWIPMGRWSVDRRYPSGTNVIIYDCFDDLVRAETEYISALTYPTTLQAVWNEVISQAGLTSSVTLPSVTVTAAISGQTCRNALGDIAGRASGSVIIDRDGDVDIIYPYQNITSALTVDKSKYDIFVEIDGTSRTISRVTCIYNDNGDYITLGDDTGYEMIFYSTLIRSTADLQDVFDDYDGLSFFPYTNLEWIGDPRTDCGDLITVTDKNDIDQTVYVMTNKLHYGGGLSMTNTSMVYSETESEFPAVGYGKERLIRKSIIQGVPYYGVAINTDFGIKITRSDGVSETTINSDTWEVLIDGVQKLYADYAEGKLIFDGTLTADVIEAIQTVVTANLTAEKAVIAELTVDRLNTSDAVGNYLISDTSDIDYIDIRDEEISFWTATTTGTSTVQVTNRNGELLYWLDDTYSGSSTEVTPYPVLRYVYETELQKMKIEFENVDGTREPVITMGAGTGVDKNGKSEIRKALDGFRITYYDSSTGDESYFVMGDDGNIISPGINPVNSDNNVAIINLPVATPVARPVPFTNIQDTYQNFIFSAEMDFPTDAQVTVQVDQDGVTQYNKSHFVKAGGDTLTLSKILQPVAKGAHQVDVILTSNTAGIINVADYDAEVQQFPYIYTPVNPTPDYATFVYSIRSRYSVGSNLIIYIEQDEVGDSYVYNDDNESDVPTYFEVSGSAGVYSVTYTLDNNPSESYTTDFSAFDEIVWEVYSQSRVDGTDLVGTDVTIVNNSDLPVNVYVTGDDETDPRFNVVSTTGTVNIYDYQYVPANYTRFIEYTIETTTSSEVYTLPHGWNGTPTEDMYIIWGDGGSSSVENIDYNMTLNSKTHTYDTAGTYTIQLMTDEGENGHPNWYGDTKVVSLDYPIKASAILPAQKVNAGFLLNLFRECDSLTGLPSLLVDEEIDGILGAETTFALCPSLQTVPNTIFDNFPEMLQFYFTFYASGLTAYPNGITDNLPDMNNFNYAFGGCVSMTNACDELWNDFPTAVGTDCFDSCTSLTNYASIPAGWK